MTFFIQTTGKLPGDTPGSFTLTSRIFISFFSRGGKALCRMGGGEQIHIKQLQFRCEYDTINNDFSGSFAEENMIYWIVWLCVCIAFLVLNAVTVLPILFRWLAGAVFCTADRGLEKFNLKNGVAVLYEPDRITARYIKRYQLYKRTEELCATVFVGEWARQIKSAEYELSAYDRYDLLLAKKRIGQTPQRTRFTGAVLLPSETDRVSLTVRSANGERVSSPKRQNPFFLFFLTLFALAAVFELLGIIFVATVFLSRAFGGFEAERLPLTSSLWCHLLLPSALALFALIFTAGCFYAYRAKLFARLSRSGKRLRSVFNAPLEKCARLWRRCTSSVRAVFMRCGCAVLNSFSGFLQSGFCRSLSGAVSRLKRSVAMRRRKKNVRH